MQQKCVHPHRGCALGRSSASGSACTGASREDFRQIQVASVQANLLAASFPEAFMPLGWSTTGHVRQRPLGGPLGAETGPFSRNSQILQPLAVQGGLFSRRLLSIPGVGALKRLPRRSTEGTGKRFSTTLKKLTRPRDTHFFKFAGGRLSIPSVERPIELLWSL